MPTPRRPRIGISACLWAGDPNRQLFNGRPLYCLEQSLAHYLQRTGAAVYLIPPLAPELDAHSGLAAACADLDGLVLHGGIDVAPQHYGEEPERPEWAGEARRDSYDLALIAHFRAQQKPILGICRGLQILNVSFGGSLYQDLPSMVGDKVTHRDAIIYDRNYHTIDLVGDSLLGSLYAPLQRAKVNSVHHQAVKVLAAPLQVAARSSKDGVIEAICLPYTSANDHWCVGVQWHPEFQKREDASLLNPDPLLNAFYAATLTTAQRQL